MTTSVDEMRSRVDDLIRRHQAASSKKSQLLGRLEAKKQELAALSREIKEAGYDPKSLKSERDKAAQQLETATQSFAQDLALVEKALADIEQQNK